MKHATLRVNGSRMIDVRVTHHAIGADEAAWVMAENSCFDNGRGSVANAEKWLKESLTCTGRAECRDEQWLPNGLATRVHRALRLLGFTSEEALGALNQFDLDDDDEFLL